MSGKRQRSIWPAVVLVCLLGAPLLLLFLFLFVLGTYSGHTQVTLRFLGGFYFFLQGNLPRISGNAATWVPGVAALAMGAGAIHLFMRPWAVKRGRLWPPGNSLALTAVIPVLFVIAFLVPGVLLQLQGLSETKWFFREWGKTDDLVETVVERYRWAAIEHAEAHGGKFPETLEELRHVKAIESLEGDARHGRHHWDLDMPHEPLIYLGAGLTIHDDGDPVLIISPPFSEDGMRVRMMARITGKLAIIPEDEAEALIRRSLDARRGSSMEQP